MPTTLTINGVGYSYPVQGDQSWGTAATAWATAVTNGMLQMAGGNFTLTANVNFGATYGLLTAFYQSQSSNTAETGVVRLANNSDAVSWRNAANSEDLALAVNASNQLTFNGNPIVGSGGSGAAGTVLTGQGTSSLPTYAATVPLGVASNTAGILTLAAAATAGVVTIQQLGASSNYNFNLPTTAGTTGQVLASAGGSNSSMTWANAVTNPMTTLGDTVYGGASGVFTRLAGQTTATLNILTQTGTGSASAAPAWSTLTSILPMTTLGDTIYGGASGVATRLAGQTSSTKNFLTQTGNGSTSAAPTWSALTVPTIQTFLQTNYYTFTISSATVAAGQVYSNNSSQFTVVYAISSGTTLVAYRSSGTNAPSGSGTLTYVSGTDSGNLTYSAVAANGTYFPTSTSVLYIKVTAVGGGGGGASSGTSAGSGNNGNNGTATTFGSSLLSAGGGTGGGIPNNQQTGGGAGGTNSFGSGTQILNVAGGQGNCAASASNSTLAAGGQGGSSFFGGAGAAPIGAAGAAAATNSGSGGAGGGCGITSGNAGNGGGAGGSLVALISSVASSYIFNVGSGGATVSAPSNYFAGGAGGSGQIIVEEFYQ